jgi:thiamine-phosphate pyrophosphorylase
MKLRGLYAITPEHAGRDVLPGLVAQALEGGIAALQYRRKAAADVQEARTLAALCRRHGVPFIVNDDLALALEAGADGLHLGREDGALPAARQRLAGQFVGASCYDSLDAARAAVARGADYVAFGSVFASPTKPAAVRAPHTLFGAARSLGVPLVAIGGITLENAPLLLQAGADALAVISDLFDAPDIAARARAYGKLFQYDNA